LITTASFMRHFSPTTGWRQKTSLRRCMHCRKLCISQAISCYTDCL